MTQLANVRRTIDVSVDPTAAFEMFTEIGGRWRPGPHSFVDPTQAAGVRMEPGPGGRWWEAWNDAAGTGYERGRIIGWDRDPIRSLSRWQAGHARASRMGPSSPRRGRLCQLANLGWLMSI